MFRRLLDFLTALLAALSLLLCVSAVALWVRSYWVTESFTFDPRIEWRPPHPPADRPWFEGWQRYWTVGSSRGRLVIHYFENVHRPRQEAEHAAREAKMRKNIAEINRRVDEMFRRLGRPPPPPQGPQFPPPPRRLTGYGRFVPQFGIPANPRDQPPVVRRYDIPWLIEFAKLERRIPPPDVGGLVDGGKLFVSLPWLIPALLFSLLPLAWTKRRLRHLRMARRAARGGCPACGYDLRATPGQCPECGTPKAEA